MLQQKPFHLQTPIFESKILSQLTQKTILLKMDCYQPTGSFKIRGIGRLCQELVAAGHHHLISSSGGNAGYTAAYVGNKLGVKVTVFVPKTTNKIFLKYLELENATVKIQGDVWDETHQAAMEYVHQVKGAYIPPFDHPTIWAGNSTIIDEAVQQCEKPDAIIAAVGGGGLMCGILDGMQRNNWLDVATFSVETEGAASFAATVKAGKLVTLPKIDTIATSLGAKQVTHKLFEWSKKHPITPLVVTDKSTVSACKQFLDDHRVLVEPACGAPLSVIYDQAPELKNMKSILVIVCGGVGLSLEKLQEYIQKYGV